jgi:RNA polymerase sigma factor (sigma-70 family)
MNDATAEVARRAALALPHLRDLTAWARRHLACPGDAQDAASETLTRYLASATAGDVPDDEVRRYLFGILRHVVSEANEAVVPPVVTARLAAQVTVPEADHADSIADRALDADTLARTELLPEPQRDALQYRAEGLTLAQAAQRAGVGERTAESRLTAARRTLRRVAAPVAALLSLWRVRPRRAAVLALAVAAVAVVPAVLRVAPDPSGPEFVTEAAPGPDALREGRGGDAASRATNERARAAAPTAPPTPTPTPTPSREGGRGRESPATPNRPTVAQSRVFTTPTADRPLLDVVRECVENGVEVTPERVGCRS